jgi:predicted methyltransferase
MVFVVVVLAALALGVGVQGFGPVGVIGHFEAAALLELRHQPVGTQSMKSLDLGRTECSVFVTEEGIGLNPPSTTTPSHIVDWSSLERIVQKAAKKGQFSCYELYDDADEPEKINTISKSSNRPASLCASMLAPGPPTMVLGGFTMHRITGGSDPRADTGQKIIAAGPINGRVLDTCTGLGYTAIVAAAAAGASSVVTCEVDEASLEMCSRNPWSKDLFEDPKITVMRGDCCELVNEFADGSFAVVIHDPPALALCKESDLYGLRFYSQLHRVLQPGGKLYHYVGRFSSKESGRLYKGIQDRLMQAGFSRIKPHKESFGIVAIKH